MLLNIFRWIVGLFCVGVVGLFAAFVILFTFYQSDRKQADREGLARDLQVQLSRVSDARARAVIENRVSLGQAIICGINQDKVLRLMSTTNAMIAAFTKSDAAADEAGNEAVKIGAQLQKIGAGASCSEVSKSVEILSNYVKSQGL